MLKLHPSWFVFFLTVVMGIALVISSDNWFMMWIGFELSLLGFLPMFSGSHLTIEGMIKYFLVQAGGSTMFLLAFIWEFNSSGLICLLSMLLKMGLFPFYQWVPMVMTSLPWLGCLLLSTLQKIAPLSVLIMQPSNQWSFMLLSCALSILTSGILGFNQSYLRALMGYSSISHSGWLLCTAFISTKLTWMYFCAYAYITSTLFTTFHKLHSLKITSGSQSPKLWGVASLLLLTLAGIPPFSMFFLKVMILSALVPFSNFVVIILLGTMLSIFYYLNFIIPSMMVYWNNLSANKTSLVFHSWIGSLLYPILLTI